MLKVYNYFYFWFPVTAYSCLIFYLSSGPVNVQMPSIKHIDKLIHTGEYALLSFLYVFAFFKSLPKKNRKRLKYLSIGLAFLYGISDEIHQSFVPSRSADIFDVVFDGLGAVIGQKVYCYFWIDN